MSEKLASAEIPETRERLESRKRFEGKFYPFLVMDRNELGYYRATETKWAWEAYQVSERDTRERIAQLAREVAKEVGGQFAETHMLNTALNKFIARLERIRGVNR